MQALVYSWQQNPYAIKDRWFRQGPYSEFKLLSIGVTGGAVKFWWNYTWMDFGFCNSEDVCVTIVPDGDWYVVGDKRCLLEDLEALVFGGVWQRLERCEDVVGYLGGV
jgi:hypothetical protein